MDLKERIVAYMRDVAYKPLSATALAEAMKLTDEDLVEFDAALEELEELGAIIKNRSDLYGIPSRMHLVVGKLSVSSKGFGFVMPDVRETEDETDVYVPAANIGSAMHGDRVVARVVPATNLRYAQNHSREGEIIRVLKRANEKIVGTFERSKNFGFVKPDNTKLNNDIFIPKKAFKGATTGSKVVVRVTRWPEKRHSAEGVVEEVLGQAGEPGVDILSVMRQYELDEKFPDDVQAAASAIEQKLQPKEYLGRADRRNLKIVTIDGDDSKDLDDGVYARQNPDGSFFLGVYIADVSWYVRENQPLDREAYARGTSVYLVDRVIPMLPKELSNGICSLNAGVDRLAMACEMQISPQGEVASYEILPTVIHVYRRLTYNIVNKVLADKDERFVTDNEDILPLLKTLESLREVLKAKRRRRGAIDFDVAEVKVKLDANGAPIALIKREGSLSESIIEECMLIANETVARHMDTKNLPFMYRVHEQPTTGKIERLNNLLAAFGLYVRPDENGAVKPMDIQQVLNKVVGRPEEKIISTVSLRSMQQARYAAQSLGHFGLAARYYTHFTSPIRRYPDLIVHRLLRETFPTGSLPLERQVKLREILPEIADHSSERERLAVDAERETTDLKKIEYMEQFVGEDFSAVISGVTAFGIFVELDNGVEGLVHVSTMIDDYYEYVEEQYAMIGSASNKRYRLGDEVEVRLIRANRAERNLDFVLLDNGLVTTKKKSSKSDKVKLDKKAKVAADKTSTKKKTKSARPPRRKELAGGLSEDEIIAEPMVTDWEKHNNKRSHHKQGGSARRLNRQNTKREQLRSSKIEAKIAKHEERRANREKRRRSGDKKAGDDYQRVYVTGLNEAVWPDPPGYHERKEREILATEKNTRRTTGSKRKPLLKRKTEGGTTRNK